MNAKDFMKKYGRYVGLSVMFASLYVMGVLPQNLVIIAAIVLSLGPIKKR